MIGNHLIVRGAVVVAVIVLVQLRSNGVLATL
jgi:hypothetical protein